MKTAFASISRTTTLKPSPMAKSILSRHWFARFCWKSSRWNVWPSPNVWRAEEVNTLPAVVRKARKWDALQVIESPMKRWRNGTAGRFSYYEKVKFAEHKQNTGTNVSCKFNSSTQSVYTAFENKVNEFKLDNTETEILKIQLSKVFKARNEENRTAVTAIKANISKKESDIEQVEYSLPTRRSRG